MRERIYTKLSQRESLSCSCTGVWIVEVQTSLVFFFFKYQATPGPTSGKRN